MEISPVTHVTATLPNLNPVQLAQAAATTAPPLQIRLARATVLPNSNTMVGAVVQSKLLSQSDEIGPPISSGKVLKPYGIASFRPAPDVAEQRKNMIH